MREEGPVWWTMEQIKAKTDLLIAFKDVSDRRYMLIGPYQLILTNYYLEYVN